MQLSVNLFTSLDGVSQAPGGPEEDPRNGFRHGGWLLPLFDAEAGEVVDDWFSRTEALLLGRFTYDTFAGYWPRVTDPDDLIARTINTGPKYVVTSRPVGPVWAETTTVLGADFLDRIRQLKQQPGGELQVHGSVRLARTLHEAGLVDTDRLLVAPVVLGGGWRLFTPEGPAYGMNVDRLRTTPSGMVAYTLAPHDLLVAEAGVDDGRDTIRPVADAEGEDSP